MSSILYQQNAQFDNAKERNFRSLKDCDKQICNYDDNTALKNMQTELRLFYILHVQTEMQIQKI